MASASSVAVPAQLQSDLEAYSSASQSLADALKRAFDYVTKLKATGQVDDDALLNALDGGFEQAADLSAVELKHCETALTGVESLIASTEAQAMVNDEDDATSSKVKTEDAPEPAAPVAPSKRQRSPERAAQTRQSTTAAGATPAAASPVVGTTPRSATPLSASQGKGSAASASETQPASSSTRKAASPAPGLPPVSKKRRVDLSLSADAGAGMSSPASAASERPLAPAPQQQPLVSPALSAASTGSRRASPATVPSTATEASTSALGKKPGPPATATATASTPKTRKEAIMDQLPLKRGRQAALRQPVRKGAPPGEEDWILVEVESTINNDKNRYIVVDREGDPGNAAETRFNTTLKNLIPLPDKQDKSTYPANGYASNTRVIAMYPDTTSFYGARVISGPHPQGGKNRKGQRVYSILFDDDGDVPKPVAEELVTDILL